MLVHNGVPHLAALVEDCLREGDDTLKGALGVDPHLREDDRVVDIGSRDYAASRNDRVPDDAVLAVDVLHELCGRELQLVRPDRPAPVVDVEIRHDGG